MSDNLEKQINQAIQNPQNMGEMKEADAVGTAGSAGCGDLVRMWIKFKEENGRKVIDKATFQSFGCETAIAVASLATQAIRGKTPQEALIMSSEQLAPEIGPLPPMKIHCGQLVESALKSALEQEKREVAAQEPKDCPAPAQPATTSQPPAEGNLVESFSQGSQKKAGFKIVFKEPGKEKGV